MIMTVIIIVKIVVMVVMRERYSKSNNDEVNCDDNESCNDDVYE